MKCVGWFCVTCVMGDEAVSCEASVAALFACIVAQHILCSSSSVSVKMRIKMRSV